MVYLDDVNFVDLLKDKLDMDASKNLRKYGSLGTVCPQYNLQKTATKIAEDFLVYYGMKPIVFAMSSYGFIYEKGNGYKFTSFIEVSCDKCSNDFAVEEYDILEKLRKLYIVSTGEKLVHEEGISKIMHGIEIKSKKEEVNRKVSDWLQSNVNKTLISINVSEGKINIVYE